MECVHEKLFVKNPILSEFWLIIVFQKYLKRNFKAKQTLQTLNRGR